MSSEAELALGFHTNGRWAALIPCLPLSGWMDASGAWEPPFCPGSSSDFPPVSLQPLLAILHISGTSANGLGPRLALGETQEIIKHKATCSNSLGTPDMGMKRS